MALGVLLLAIALITVAAITLDACRDPERATRLLMYTANGCFEFWLNRYQGLLGGILALVGAGVAFAAVRMQIFAQYEIAARTARVIAIASLRDFHDDCQTRLNDASNFDEAQSGQSFEVPELSIDNKPEVIAQFGPKEGGGLFQFCREVRSAREGTRWMLDNVSEDESETIERDLRRFKREAARLINKFSRRVGWDPFMSAN